MTRLALSSENFGTARSFEILSEIHFAHGGVLVAGHGRLRLRDVDGLEWHRSGKVEIRSDGVSICSGPWNQVLTVDGEHRLSRLHADFMRGVARTTTVVARQGQVVEAWEQYLNGLTYRPAYKIRWRGRGRHLILRTSSGELTLSPFVPLEWTLAAKV